MIRPVVFCLWFLIVCLFGSTLVSAQSISTRRDATVWYFGVNAGMTFANGAPIPLTNGALSTLEGSSGICHPVSGQLLFYTDGVTVWDATHAMMANGSGLKGHWTSAQSALIVPQPGDTNIYYIFTTGAGLYHTGTSHGPHNNGFRYSIVDMRLNGGRGAVTIKNVELLARSTEMLTATRHCNGVDYWIVAHDWNTQGGSGFRSYLLTSQGVSDTVVSETGTDYTDGTHTQNMAKLSSNGKLMAVTCATLQTLELYDFDNATGTVSNARLLGTGFNYYSATFSPDNLLLYTSSLTNQADPNYIYQFSLRSLDTNEIRNSRYEVHKHTGTWQGAQIQLGPDGKIYASYFGRNVLGVINNPNLAGAACNYVDEGFALNGKETQYGLPNFIESDVFGTAISSVSTSVLLESSVQSAQPGQTVQMRLVSCNNSSLTLNNVDIEVTLPTGLSYISGLSNYPHHIIPSLLPGVCDTVTFQVEVGASQPGGTRLTSCASLLASGSGGCFSVSDSSCVDLRISVPVGPVDYTFYAVAACPGVHDTVQVLFHSRGVTDTIIGIDFAGSDGPYYSYAKPGPVLIPITPTSDQYIPVYVQWPGLGRTKVTGIMTLTTISGDTFRIGIENTLGRLITPVLSVKSVHLGTWNGLMDTCLTVTNITKRAIRFTDTTWVRRGSGAALMTSLSFPRLLGPGAQMELCVQATSPGPLMSDTLLLGGVETGEHGRCALAIIVVDGQSQSTAGVLKGENGRSETLQMRVLPNPAHTRTEIELDLAQPNTLRLMVLGLNGIEHIIMGEQRYETGKHVLSIDVANLSTGSYWVVVDGSTSRLVQQLVVIH